MCCNLERERERERNHKYPQQLTHSDPDSITVTGSVSTARKSEEIVWLMSALGIVAEDFAQALSDLLTQDARLEAGTAITGSSLAVRPCLQGMSERDGEARRRHQPRHIAPVCEDRMKVTNGHKQF